MARSSLAGLVLAGVLAVLDPAPGGGVPAERSRGPAWGTVRGRVTWGGKVVPKPQPVRVTHDREYILSGGPVFSEQYVVHPRSRGVRWVFVWLAPAPKQTLPVHPDLRGPRDSTVSMNLAPGRFEPHALAVRRGQEVAVSNPGPIAYNLRWEGTGVRNPGGNVLIAPRGSYTIRNLNADRLPVRLADNIHPWMTAWLWVFDHPYFAVTDVDGAFTIRQAPAGTFRLVVWHEGTGWGPGGRTGIDVTVPRGRDEVVPVELKPPEG